MVCLLLALLGTNGCVVRESLSASTLDDVRRIWELDMLRVYPSRRIITEYRPGPDADGSAPDRQRVVLGRRIAGKILSIDERDGRRWLYVTFSSDCELASCAYTFVGDASGLRYRLADVPQLPGMAPPDVHVATTAKSNRLQRSRPSPGLYAWDGWSVELQFIRSRRVVVRYQEVCGGVGNCRKVPMN